MDEHLQRRFGDLIPVRALSNGLWRYRCVRLRATGEDCGNVRDLPRYKAGLYSSCVECAHSARHHARPRGVNVNAVNFRKIRAQFTEQQWMKYHEILRGRRDLESQRDAVEIVLIEGRLPEGVCCKACLRKRAA